MRHHLSLIVQASSVSWSGGKDLCMNPLEGLPVLQHTLAQLRDIVGRQFGLREVIGIKQGTIWVDGDPTGGNTFLVASPLPVHPLPLASHATATTPSFELAP